MATGGHPVGSNGRAKSVFLLAEYLSEEGACSVIVAVFRELDLPR